MGLIRVRLSFIRVKVYSVLVMGIFGMLHKERERERMETEGANLPCFLFSFSFFSFFFLLITVKKILKNGQT